MLYDLDLIQIFAAVVDIALVAYFIYKILILIRGTRAVQLLKGIFILLIALNISGFLHLSTVQWILGKTWAVIFVALAVVFQPELRRALEHIGRGQFFTSPFNELKTGDAMNLINEIAAAFVDLSEAKTGALLVIEKETGLNDFIDTGIQIDGKLTSEFLVNIYEPNTPLHDGAAIVRGNRIVSAACFLPLSDNPYLDSSLGTRHRAALGITEASDALALIVSEETGSISLAYDGKLVRHLREENFKEMLREKLIAQYYIKPRFWKRRDRYGKKQD